MNCKKFCIGSAAALASHAPLWQALGHEVRMDGSCSVRTLGVRLFLVHVQEHALVIRVASGWMGGWVGKQTNKQTDRQINKQTSKQTNKQINK